MRQLRLYIALMLVACALTKSSWAQFTLNSSVTRYEGTKFLPTNTIYSACLDKQQYLWIGTDAGLFKFNGHSAKAYTKVEGLPNNEILRLFYDSHDRLWICTYSHEVCYIRNDSLYTPKNDPMLAQIQLSAYPVEIFEADERTIIVLGTAKNKIVKIVGSQVTTLFEDHERMLKENFLKVVKFQEKLYFVGSHRTLVYSDNKLSEVAQSPKCDVVCNIATIGSNIYYFKTENGKLTLQTTKDEKFFTNILYRRTRSLIYYNNDKIVLFGNNRIDVVNRNTDEVLSYACTDHVTAAICLPGDDILYTTVDNGAFVIKKNNLFNFERNSTKKAVNTIAKLGADVFLGNVDRTLDIFNYKNFSSKNIPIGLDAPLVGQQRVVTFVPWIENKVFIGTDYGPIIFNRTNNSYNQAHDVFAIAIKGATCFRDTLFITGNSTLEIKSKDSAYSVGVNTLLTGIHAFQNELYYSSYKKLVKFNTRTNASQIIDSASSRIIQLLDFNDELLILTAEDGLFKYTKQGIKPFIPITNFPLNPYKISKATVYKHKIYFATHRGIMIYADGKFEPIINTDAGLSTNTVNDLCVSNDTIYAATKEGFSIIPLAAAQDTTSFINMLFTSAFDGTKRLELDGKGILASDKGVKLYFDAVNFFSEGAINFHYQINNGQVITTTDNYIDFAKYQPGDYVVSVYATDAAGIASKKISVTIRINAKWYQHALFYLVFAAALIFLIWYFVNRYQKRAFAKKILAQEREQEELNLKLAAWSAKINPHFIFNSLTALQSLMFRDLYDKADEYIIKFSSIIRHTLTKSEQLSHTIADEKKYLTSYLDLQKINRTSRLEFSFDIDDKLLPYQIPSLLIQPIIENSIKHFNDANTVLRITISITSHGDTIVCRITDNGIGIADIQKSKDSQGLKLIGQRAETVNKFMAFNTLYTYENLPREKGTGLVSTITFNKILVANDKGSNS
jgi:hypothetical protein